MDIGGNLAGFDDLDKALGNFEARTERKLSLTALRAGGRVIIKHAKQNVPIDDGVLKKSFMTKAGRFRPGEDITLIVGTKGGKKFGWYAHFVEFGTANAKATPFFRPAFDEHPREIVEAIGGNLAKGIIKATAAGVK